MKKLLLFLVLLGAGLAVLAWLEEDTRPKVDPEQEGPPRADVSSPPAGIDQGISLGGAFNGRIYDEETGRVLLSVNSEESGTRGSEDVFVDLTLEMLDPKTESTEAQVSVKSRRARISRTGARPDFEPRHEPRVYLEELQATFVGGLPIVPLTITTAAAEIDATNTDARTLSSEETIELSSERLVGGGQGFLVNLDEELLVIRNQGWIEFREEEDVSIRFSSLERGALQVYHELNEEPDALRIEAWEGTRLQILGEARLTLDAEHIMARGVRSGEEDEIFQIRSLEADGNVVWIFGDNEFRGDRATIEFDAQGELVEARLEGPPTSAKLALEAEDTGFEDVNAAEVGSIQVFGNRSIVITRDERTNFEVDGPATVEAQGFRLRSNGALNGWLALDGRSARFVARGGVVLEGGRADLETAEFELTLQREEDGSETLRGLAKGGARLAGSLVDGRKFTASTPEELEVLRLGESLQIVNGSRVEVAIDEPDGLRASADEIRDVDLALFSFTALGNVEIHAADVHGRGDEFVATGPEDYVLRGSAERRARLENAEGWAEALTIATSGGRLHAQGNVEADLTDGVDSVSLDTPAYRRYRLTGDELMLDRSESQDEAANTSTRVFDLEVTGAVKARVRAGTENTELDCAHLVARRSERFTGIGPARERVAADTELLATGKVDGHLTLKDSELDLKCDDLKITGKERAGEEDYQQAVATGNVTFLGTSEIDFRGRGELLILDTERVGTLEAPKAGRVELGGLLPSFSVPFRMTAERIEFAGENLIAVKPELRVGGSRAKGDLLETTPEELHLTGSARLTGTSKNNLPWTLDAEAIDLRGQAELQAAGVELSTIEAHRNVVFRLGNLITAHGDLLSRKTTGIMHLIGAPARIGSDLVEYEAEWIDFDPDLQIIQQTGKGRVRPGPKVRAQNAERNAATPIKSFGPKPLQDELVDPGWSLEFLSSSTLFEPDSLVHVIQEPVFRYALDGVESTMRATWTILWLDRQGWLDLPDNLAVVEGSEAAPAQVAGPMGRFFHLLDGFGIGGVVTEAYFEGPVEVLSDEDVVAHADAIYLSVTEGHGWLANATVNILGKHLGQSFEQITIKADWLRHSADGSLHADDATVSPCDFSDPHTKIVTGDLRITPLEGESRFHLDMGKNRIELYDLPTLPLPPLSFDTDENLKPFWPSMSIGNSARFGSLFGLKFGGSSKAVAKLAEKATGSEGKKEREFDANYEVDAKYLGSRGGLLDVGLELKSKERYWFELYTGIVYDTGKDEGYIRVSEDDRDDIRLWLRGLNTIQLGNSRLTLAYTDQSDAGVQSEFWESDFVEYEQTETYLQWKRPADNTYTQVTGLVRTDGFIPGVEELPSGSAFLGRAPIFELGKYSVIHTGSAQASYLRRREGSDPVSPFGLPETFGDGLGNREVLRADTSQELEVPIPLGFAGLKLIPFTMVQAAAWNEAIDEDDSASRVVAQAGARLGTTFWKLSPGGVLHSISPYLEYSNEVASEFNEDPVVFSQLEAEVFGNFIEAGVRSRLGIEEGRSAFDLEVVGVYASDRSDGEEDGWLPIELFGRVDISPFRQLLEVWHDARYNVENGQTKFSIIAIGSRAGQDLQKLGWQVAHHRGRDDAGQALFEALSVAGFYRWTEKWEFEGSHSFSLLEDQGLGFDVIVRRYGHDMIFDLETSYREGEGSSFGISFSPRLGHRPSKIGYLNW